MKRLALGMFLVIIGAFIMPVALGSQINEIPYFLSAIGLIISGFLFQFSAFIGLYEEINAMNKIAQAELSRLIAEIQKLEEEK